MKRIIVTLAVLGIGLLYGGFEISSKIQKEGRVTAVRSVSGGRAVAFELSWWDRSGKTIQARFRLDLKSGKYSRMDSGSLTVKKPRVPNVSGSILVEPASGRRFRLRGIRKEGKLRGVLVSRSAGLAVLWYTAASGSRLRADTFRLVSGRLIRRVYLPVTDTGASSIQLLGRTIYLQDEVGAGPGGTGWLYSALTGRKLALVRGRAKYGINMYGGSVHHVRGRIWLFVSGDGGELVWMDVVRGRRIRALKIPEAEPDSGTTAITIPGRRLLVLYGARMAGTARIIRLDSGKLLRVYRP